MALEDKNLNCKDCGKEFIFTSGEQEFYASRGLMNEPRRCPECRSIARRQRNQAGENAPSQRPVFSAVCASCAAETTVPFEPTEGRPVYCRDCYTKMRA